MDDGDYPVTWLVDRAAAGDEQAWQEIVERYAPLLASVTRRFRLTTAEAQDVVNAGIAKVTGQAMSLDTIRASWGNMTFTFDPLASTMSKEADNAKSVGLLDSSVKLDGIYDLSILNKLLNAAGRPTVPDH